MFVTWGLLILRVVFPHTAHKRAERACIFKRFLIFLFLEYRKLAMLVLLLGTRRQIKIKNHLKSASQRDIIYVRYVLRLYMKREKLKFSQKYLPGLHFLFYFYFMFSLIFPATTGRSTLCLQKGGDL